MSKISRRNFVKAGVAVGGVTFMGLPMGCGSSNDPEGGPETGGNPGKWMSGEMHNHTGMSNDTQSYYVTLGNILGVSFRDQVIIGSLAQDPDAMVDNIKYGAPFDYLFLADHFRNSYPFSDAMGEWINRADYNAPLWQALETQYNDAQALQAIYPDKIIYHGFEWDMPMLDHAAVGFIDSNSDEPPYAAIHEFEWIYAQLSEEKQPIWGDSFDELAAWGPRKQAGGETVTQTYEGVQWIKDRYPESYLIINHPSRRATGSSDEIKIENFRKMNDIAPDIVIGVEGMPGGMLTTDAYGGGGGFSGGIGGRTYALADEVIAITGGVWDSLLSEGRRFYNFANADFHFKHSPGKPHPVSNALTGANNASDYWIGEFSRNWTYVLPNNESEYTFRDVVNAWRSGNSYAVFGELISDLDFSISGKTMGEELVVAAGSEVTLNIRFKRPAKNNYATLHGSPVKYGATNVPDLARIDVISGTVTGKIGEFNPDYSNPNTSDAEIIHSFTSADWGSADAEGFYSVSLTMNLDADCFVRIRGFDSRVEFDVNNDPKVDARATSGDSKVKADERNDFNYSHLCFYANPIWLKIG
jgi:hypothetical protein